MEICRKTKENRLEATNLDSELWQLAINRHDSEIMARRKVGRVRLLTRNRNKNMQIKTVLIS